jgi:leucyl aminopeptidase
MEILSTSKKDSISVELISGTLNRFDGKTLSVAYGEKKPLTRRKFVLYMRKIISVAKANKLSAIAITYADITKLAPQDFSEYETGRIAGTAFSMADYEHNTYKTAPKGGWNTVSSVAVSALPIAAKKGFEDGLLIGQEINTARELSNTPGGDMTPSILAKAAVTAAKGTKIKVKTLGMKEMTKLGMGAVVGVGKGATDEPKFIIMEYWGAAKSQKPVVLVGKGVTFDTGGIQVKTGDHMYEMHMDMSGGAAVIHAVALAAKLKIKANVVGLIPAVENAVGPGAMHPGDILKSLSGKTIEILHTDAEGRVILADALTYAKRYSPAIVADAATLTGAALTAFGEHANAFMTNTESMIPDFQQLGEESGDYMWPMPLWEEYDYIVKGRFGDVPNIPAIGNSRYAGVIGGGKFLEVFTKELECPWVHIDMAPKMTASPDEYLTKGAAGSPIRLFLALIEKYAA